MVINTLKGMIVRLALVEAALAEVKVGTDLAVEPRTFNGCHAAPITPVQSTIIRVLDSMSKNDHTH